MTPPPLVLLHGLFMNSWIMRPLGRRLAAAGFAVHYFDYASTRAPVADQAEQLKRFITERQLERPALVGHSLGGLVLRAYLAAGAEAGPVLTIATPHRGSAVARAARRLVGRAWHHGLDGQLPPLPKRFGQIVGLAPLGLGRLLVPLSALNDGTVDYFETAHPCSDRLVLAGNHTGLLFSAAVAAATLHYLQQGHFMNDQQRQRHSKFLSYVLRHHPEEIGLTLDKNGWVAIDTLLRAVARRHPDLTREALLTVVANCEKRRFTLSPDGTQIRAAQGHSSAQVAIEHERAEPPPLLYHGTAKRFLPSIRAEGLLPRGRHWVHLSGDVATATKVGARHGAPVVLVLDTRKMNQPFYRADNGVWLVERVAPEFLQFPDED